MKHENKLAVLIFALLSIIGQSKLYSQDSIIDNDNNTYKLVTIGAQVWMAENLKTTKYSDGTAILLVKDNTLWRNLTTPGYCWYNNDSVTYKNTYGALYNWYAIDTLNLCPQGWHVSTNKDWKILTTYLGGEIFAGGKIKEKGTIHWKSPNTGADNSSGFTALPGGYRDGMGGFNYLGNYGIWWSVASHGIFKVWKVMLFDYGAGMDISYDGKNLGFSVRCVKD
jgi:uncharacterized protein (TIGR02145 family)